MTERDNGSIIRIVRKSLDERLIDLQRLDLEALEISKGRVAGAEVVDRQREAGNTESIKDGRPALRHQRVFGDFELESVDFFAELPDRPAGVVDDCVTADQLARRYVDSHFVDVDSQLSQPGQIAAYTLYQPRSEIDDKSTFFGDRNEFCGRHRFPVGQCPPC